MDEKEAIKTIRRRLTKLGYKLHVGAPNAFARFEIWPKKDYFKEHTRFFLSLPGLQEWVEEQEQSNATATI